MRHAYSGSAYGQAPPELDQRGCAMVSGVCPRTSSPLGLAPTGGQKKRPPHRASTLPRGPVRAKPPARLLDRHDTLGCLCHRPNSCAGRDKVARCTRNTAKAAYSPGKPFVLRPAVTLWRTGSQLRRKGCRRRDVTAVNPPAQRSRDAMNQARWKGRWVVPGHPSPVVP